MFYNLLGIYRLDLDKRCFFGKLELDKHEPYNFRTWTENDTHVVELIKQLDDECYCNNPNWRFGFYRTLAS